MNTNWKGTGVAVVTPFNSNGSVDYTSLEKIINHLIYGGVEYLVILGTTGETATLSEEEKSSIWKFVSEKNQGRVPLVAGIGGNNTAHVVEQLNAFDTKGYDAILSVSPYYNKPSQEGIFLHYMEVMKASKLPIIIYNVPGRTGSNITAETILRLASASKKFIGVKEASGNLSQITRIIQNKPKDFFVISGDDNLTLPMMSFGVDGVISVSANAYPRQMSDMVRAALKNDFQNASTFYNQVFEFTEAIFAESSPAGIKVALNKLNLCENVLRLPAVVASAGINQRILASMF